MRFFFRTVLSVIFLAALSNSFTYSSSFIPANNPFIQYFGRWDTSDSLHPCQSWPGVYICAEFTGRTIGIKTNDTSNYYNVYIDNKLHSIFHGNKSGDAEYLLADKLKNTRHTFRLSKRNFTFDKSFAFSGILLSDGAKLLKPKPKPERKIELVGDSFTAAEGNEAIEKEMKWEDKFPVTNIDKGFAPIIARHYNAQYVTTCKSGIGMVCDWQGKFNVALPKYFDRTLMDSSEVKWNFNLWKPDVVVICLGLNDVSGLKGKDGKVSEDSSLIFRKGYVDFIRTIRGVYPGVKIIAVAAYPDWIRANVKTVVENEKKGGHDDIFYTTFDEVPNGYVANGHPTVATHKKMANQIIKGIDSFNLFPKKHKK
jgi:hypothetical protein